MKNSIKYIIMAVLVFGLGALVYLYEGGQDELDEKGRKVDSINWQKDYDSESRHPYGTYFIRQILDNGLEGHSVKDLDMSVQDYFDSSYVKSNSDIKTYFFVGKSLNLYPSEISDLLTFVNEGNNMFVSAEFLPKSLLDELFYSYNENSYFDYYNDTVISLSFDDEDFSNEYVIQNEEKGKLKTRRWRYVNYGVDYQNYGVNRGKAGYRPCFIEFEYGAGKILLHTIPQAYSNNFLSSDEGKEYVEITLSYFPESDILYDNFTQFVYDDGMMEIDYGDNSNSNQGRNIGDYKTLRFLLNQPVLRWAYFLLVAILILFVIFRGKRQQKVIPTTLANDNSSLEFTETIARLYLKQNQHNKLIGHMETIFKNKMRARYYIAYSEDAKYAERLSRKSGVEEKEITHLLKLFRGGRNITAVSDEYLINLYKKLNDFYKKAK